MRLLTRNADLEPSVCRYKYWQNFGWVSEVARNLVTGKIHKASIDPSTATFSEHKHLTGVMNGISSDARDDKIRTHVPCYFPFSTHYTQITFLFYATLKHVDPLQR